MTVDFKGRTETLEEVFGTKPLVPTQMIKGLWDFIKKNNLHKKTKD